MFRFTFCSIGYFVVLFLVFLILVTYSPITLSAEAYTKLPPVNFPSENPFSEPKRLLGKILFWDEQLSTDNSVACGTCHIPAAAGADPRIANGPGYDEKLGTPDDIWGSLGVKARDHQGKLSKNKHFHYRQQVTSRAAQSYFSGLWSDLNFWDGRAGSQFLDPQTGKVLIKQGGALENQALGPLFSAVEMAKAEQRPQELIDKLRQSSPLALATAWPVDVAQAIENNPSYSALFERAFGDSEITLARIIFAITTYERTLVANQTPWDQAMQGVKPLSYQQNLGWEFFKQSGCTDCHKPPLFTDNKFYNIGIQGQNADLGQSAITGNKAHIGLMKVPSLRNVGLKKTFMHTGQQHSLGQVIDVYAKVPFKSIASKKPNGELYNFQFTEFQRKAIIEFMQHALTDERVKHELYPFDRPQLRSEKPAVNGQQAPEVQPLGVSFLVTETGSSVPKIDWQKRDKNAELIDIEIVRNDGYHFWASRSPFIDYTAKAGKTYQYTLYGRTADFVKSKGHEVEVHIPGSWLDKLMRYFD
ncbi:hypothetical protein C2869_15970 [Saccharobesus litoralis]|uniref:Di-haem cytochrome c peroxidase domain-containing protein n=1 Tax=Saccharobesus litoralis TaxID=2172099 RepID=A0A2S0VUJ1_9ALTE|nr:cytochrome c peroxidase [Saccharobesus litoralis]AWB67832.1 hypothetical protein C2869_15970 [Saccharobesus litoralis]